MIRVARFFPGSVDKNIGRLILILALLAAVPGVVCSQTTATGAQPQRPGEAALSLPDQIDAVGNELQRMKRWHEIIKLEYRGEIPPDFKRELADERRALEAMMKAHEVIRKEAAALTASEGKQRKAGAAGSGRKLSAVDKKLQELQAGLSAKAEQRRSLKEHLVYMVNHVPSPYRLRTYLKIQKELDPGNMDSKISQQRAFIASLLK